MSALYSGMAAAMVVPIGGMLLAAVVLFVLDITQTNDAIRRNYPLIGRFRGLFTHLGVFFRQYFFAMDREEMPFNRALRDWVDRAANNRENTIPFGSTRDIGQTGNISFVNCPYPTLEQDAAAVEPMVIGPDCLHPFTAPSLFNISAMSYGALSRVAVQALSLGAARAGCWLNTGEGWLSPYHLEGGCDLVVQIGTAKYGVRDEQGRLSDARLRALAEIEQVRMFEIKLGQGATPGKG
ncbi:MAG: FMN-binding glutamate synthase family protein, partial [Zetaproteobacteria bacterium]